MNTLVARYRWLRLALLCCAGLCLLFVYDAHREPPEARRFHALGLPSGPAAVLAEQPPFREEGNGAVLLLRAAEAVTPMDRDTQDLLASEIRVREDSHWARRSMHWYLWPDERLVRQAGGEALEKERLEALRAYVTQNAAALDLLYEAQRQDFFRFPDTYYTSMDRPHLVQVRGLMRLACCAALEAALAGDREAFERRVTAALLIPEQVQPVLVIDDMVSRSLFMQALGVLEWGLHYIAPDREALESWMSLLEQGRHASLAPRRAVYRNEAAFFSVYFSNTFFAESHDLKWGERRRSGSRRRPDSYTIVARRMLSWERRLSRWREEWTQETFFNNHAYLVTMEHLMEYAHLEPYRVVRLLATGPFIGDWFRNYRAYVHLMLMPAYLEGYRNAVNAIAQATAARTALAALLYHGDHGRFPECVTALVPDYLDALPRNPGTADEVMGYALHDDYAAFGGWFRLPLPGILSDSWDNFEQ